VIVPNFQVHEIVMWGGTKSHTEIQLLQ